MGGPIRRGGAIIICSLAALGGCEDDDFFSDYPELGPVEVRGDYGAMDVRLTFTVTDADGGAMTCRVGADIVMPCDGETTVEISYDEPGFYDTRVRVEDDRGRGYDRLVRIRVPYDPPIASLELEYEEATLMSTVAATAWAPHGSVVATGDAQGIRMWDPTTGARVARWELGRVEQAAWSPDSTRLGVLLDTRSLALHDPDTGAILSELGQANAFAWSPDSTRVLVAGTDATLKIVGAGDGALIANLTGHLGAVVAVAWSPDGSRLATGGSGELRWWVADTNGLYAEVARQPYDGTTALAWSPDSQTLASATVTAISTWTADGAPIGGVGVVGATALAYSPDGSRLAAAGPGNDIRVFDVATGIVTPLIGHTAETDAVAWRPDSARLASGGHDAALRIWNPAAATETLAVTPLPPFSAVTWSADGTRIAVREGTATVTVRDTSGQITQTIAGSEYGDLIAFRPNGTQLAASTTAADLVIADVATGAVVRRIPTDPRALAWGDDWLAVSDDAGRILAWNPDSGLLGRTLAVPRDPVSALAWSSAGTLASIGGQNALQWNVEAGTVERSYSVWSGDGRTLAWSPDAEWLALGSNVLQVVGEQSLETVGVEFPAAALTWDALAGRIAVGAGLGRTDPATLRILDLASLTTAASIPVAEVAAWSPDGQHLAVGSVAGRFAIYRVVYAVQ